MNRIYNLLYIKRSKLNFKIKQIKICMSIIQILLIFNQKRYPNIEHTRRVVKCRLFKTLAQKVAITRHYNHTPFYVLHKDMPTQVPSTLNLSLRVGLLSQRDLIFDRICVAWAYTHVYVSRIHYFLVPKRRTYQGLKHLIYCLLLTFM